MSKEDKIKAEEMFAETSKKLDEVYNEVEKLDEIISKFSDRYEATILHSSIVIVPKDEDDESGYSIRFYSLQEFFDYIGE